jgi:hypothetical protein
MFFLWLSGFGGLLLACLILKLSMTNSTKLRISLDRERDMNDTFSERSKLLAVSDYATAKAVLDSEIKRLTDGRWQIYGMMAVGAGVSILSEGFVLSHLLGTSIGGIVSALAVSCVVTLTVVSGELHEARDSDIVLRTLSHNIFLEQAAKANISDAINKKLVADSEKYIDQVLDENVLTECARALAYTVIEQRTGINNFAQTLQIAQAKREGETKLIEDRKLQVSQFLLTGDKDILKVAGESVDTEPSLAVVADAMNALQKPTVTFAKGKFTDAIESALCEHPEWSDTQIARVVTCSRTTVSNERKRLQLADSKVLPFKRDA